MTRWKVPLACKKLSLYSVELVKNNRCCFFSLLLYSILCACKLGLACLEDESSAPSKSLMLLFRDIAYTTKLLSDLLLLLLLCRRACLVYIKVTRYDRLSLMRSINFMMGSDWGSYLGMGDLLSRDIAYITKLLSDILLLLLPSHLFVVRCKVS